MSSPEASFRPFGDVVVIRLDPTPENRTVNGIFLPEQERNEVLTGTVLQVGPGRIQDGVVTPTDITVGARVAFFSANFLTRAGEQLMEAFQANYGDDCVLVYARDVLFEVLDGTPRLEV